MKTQISINVSSVERQTHRQLKKKHKAQLRQIDDLEKISLEKS